MERFAAGCGSVLVVLAVAALVAALTVLAPVWTDDVATIEPITVKVGDKGRPVQQQKRGKRGKRR